MIDGDDDKGNWSDDEKWNDLGLEAFVNNSDLN